MYGKVDSIVYFDKKLAGRLLGLPPVTMTTAVVYHTFAMPFSMQRGRPLKFVVYHRVVLGVKKQHLNVGDAGQRFVSAIVNLCVPAASVRMTHTRKLFAEVYGRRSFS